MLSKRLKKSLCLIMALVLMVVSFTSCAKAPDTSDKTTTLSTGNETSGTEVDNTTVEDTNYVPDKPVTITYAGWENPLQNAIIMDEFMKKHENIKVVPYEGGTINDEELTKLAAANSMPDIIAVGDLGLSVKNGWLIDIKPYFDADPNAADQTYDNITDMSTINNKLFVLPTGIFMVGLNVNLDLIRANNLPVPNYDWTIEEAVNIMKKSTIKGESLGSLSINWILTMMTLGAGRQEIGRASVNSQTKRFEMGEEWLQSTALYKELFDAKTSLWEQADVVGKPWEFEKDSPEAIKAEEARQQYLMETIGTVEDGWAVGKTSMQDFPTNLIGWTQWNPRGAEHAYAEYKYDFYPVPKATKEGDPRFLIISDFAGITPSSKDPRAAYEFLKYITYEAQGYIDRVNVMKNYNKEAFMEKYPDVPEEVFIDDPAFIYSKFGSGMNSIPGSNTDEARNAYRDFHPEGTPDGSPGISYLLDYIETAQLDLGRCIPGYNEAWGYVQDNIFKQIVFGNKAPADIAKELEDGANKILDNWDAAIDEVIGE